jgi:sirohydrochlorin ferrochelatase
VQQKKPFRDNENSAADPRPFALLLAAHGERRTNAENAGIIQLVGNLAVAGVAAEVCYSFIKGSPTVGEAIRALTSNHVIVYPLFLADGYFTRVALPRLLEHAVNQDAARTISLLPPLGLEPALADLIENEAAAAAHSRAVAPSKMTVVLLAHGSPSDAASRIAAERLADRVRQRQSFRDTRIALLEEAPSLAEAIADTRGPIIVVGLFAGEGMHGSDDARRLVMELQRDDIILLGPVGTFAGIDTIIATAATRSLHRDASQRL